MVDLSHWDFAERFSGYDAAALILGLEPRESEGDEFRVRVVSERLELHYRNALDRLFHFEIGDPLQIVHGKNVDRSSELPSVEMEHLEHMARAFNQDAPLLAWLEARHATKFENQLFARKVISCWLESIGMKSVYQFDRQAEKYAGVTSGRWPWGNHHTEMLGHLEAAARRFWVQYDPAEPSTANTNATVSDWLHGERKVSRTMADAIASMLRADGLATGPRR